MSKDITIEILVKSGFKQNPDKTWIYKMTGTSNFNVVQFGRERSIYAEGSSYRCYEVRIYHENCGLIALVHIKTISQFNKLMELMDINFMIIMRITLATVSRQERKPRLWLKRLRNY